MISLHQKKQAILLLLHSQTNLACLGRTHLWFFAWSLCIISRVLLFGVMVRVGFRVSHVVLPSLSLIWITRRWKSQYSSFLLASRFRVLSSLLLSRLWLSSGYLRALHWNLSSEISSLVCASRTFMIPMFPSSKYRMWSRRIHWTYNLANGVVNALLWMQLFLLFLILSKLWITSTSRLNLAYDRWTWLCWCYYLGKIISTP